MPGPSPLRTRPPKSKEQYAQEKEQKKRTELEELESRVERLKGDLPKRLVQPIQPLGRPYDTDEEKKQVYVDLIRLKASGKSNREAAEVLGVAPRTIDNYRADAYYSELEKELESEAKQRGYHVIGELISDSLEVMYDILHHGKSEFVRFKAAETLLNYAGYSVPRETAVQSSRDEAIKFLDEVKSRREVQVNIQVNQTLPQTTVVEAVESTLEEKPGLPAELAQYYQGVLPGGKLPESFARKVEPGE